MKIFNKMLLVAMTLFAMFSCNGNSNQQIPMQQVQPVEAQNQMTAPADTTMSQAQPQATPANAQQLALPEAINAFVKQYFPNAAISYAEPDHEYGGIQYDVYLNDGTELDFDANNQWDKVDCKVNPVPATLVPGAIASYVKSNFQGMQITKINRETYGYEIELSNGLDLRFGQNGQFIGMDD